MARNIPVAGKTIATDEPSIAGVSVHTQQIKLGFGADGTFTAHSSSDPLPVADDVRATGGAAMHHRVSLATDNATSVKASAGTLYGILAGSIDATPVYLKLYNKASAPTVGTDTPVLVVPIRGSTEVDAYPISVQFPKGLAFDIGIGYGIVTGITDASTAAVSADEVLVSLQYK